MSQSNNPNSPDPVILKLSVLKQAFEQESSRFKGYADTLSEAIDQLSERLPKQKTQAEIEAIKVDGFLMSLSALGAPLKNRNIIFLIDGSGGMVGNPLDKALETAKTVHDAVVGMNNVNVQAFMWGNSSPVQMFFGDVTQYRGGLNSGADLKPAILQLDRIFDVSSSVARDTNVIIVSDGDISDRREAREAITVLLKKNPKVTVDAMMAVKDRPRTDLKDMFANLSIENPGKIFSIYAGGQSDMTGLMADLLITRARRSGTTPKKGPESDKPKM